MVDTEISRSVHRAKRLSDAILLPDNVDAISPESIDNNDILRGIQSRRMRGTRKRRTDLVPDDNAEQRRLIADEYNQSQTSRFPGRGSFEKLC